MASVKAFLGGLFFAELTVAGARAVSPRFRRIQLTHTNLRDGSCNPVDKVQVLLPGAGSRTYTPFAFDTVRGQGSAQTIQYLRAGLNARPVPNVAQKVKAYWSVEKRGLD